jgi:hypothetical protein
MIAPASDHDTISFVISCCAWEFIGRPLADREPGRQFSILIRENAGACQCGKCMKRAASEVRKPPNGN